jgi:hypothetical protein
MRFPAPKFDLWITVGSVALLGASRVIGDDPTHHLEIVLFWAGIGGFALLALWHLLALVVNLIHAPRQEAAQGVDNRGGAYIGGDNSGTQQVFHGPVTIHPGSDSLSPGRPPREFIPRDLTPLKLMDIFENQTTFHARKQTESYYGKWLPLSGRVRTFRVDLVVQCGSR